MFTRDEETEFLQFRVNASAIRDAVKRQCVDPIIALSKNNAIMYDIADMAIKLVNKYVPYKTGALRASAYITQHARSTTIQWGSAAYDAAMDTRTAHYAPIRYDVEANHYSPTPEGTTPQANWLDKLDPGTVEYQKLVDYAQSLMRKAVKK